MTRYISLIVICLVLAGCGESDTMRRLGNADAVIESDSYAAMDTLELVKGDDLRSDEERAFYALLFTQAQIKNWIAVDSDSLIGRAYDYYRDRREGDRTIRAYFYKAKVAYNAKNLQGAVRDALAAYEMAKANGVPYWIARSAELLSDIFFDVYNYPLAEEYSRETVLNYGLAGRESSQRYAIADLANIYLNENRDSLFFYLADSLRSVCLPENPVDAAVLDYIRVPYINALIKNKRFDKIDEYYSNDFENIEKTVYPFNEAKRISMILTHQGRYEDACKVLNNAQLHQTQEDSAHCLYIRYLNAKESGNLSDIVSMTDSIISLQSKVAQSVLYQHVNQEKSDFYNRQADEFKDRNDRITTRFHVYIVVSVVILLILLFFYLLIVQKRKAEHDAMVASLLIHKNRVSSIEKEKLQTESELETEQERVRHLETELSKVKENSSNKSDADVVQRLFQGQWSTLNMLCDEYFEKSNSENTRKYLFRKIEEEIKRQSSPENIKKIEDQVNSYLSGIVTKLREQCPMLTENQINFLTLNYAGLSIRAICLFTGISYKTFHNKRAMVAKLIAEHSPQDKELFLRFIKSN